MRALLVILLAGCAPDLGPSASLIDHDRLLAVRADPAETAPGSMVRYSTLLAGPSGAFVSPSVSWAWCTAPKPLTEQNTVTGACLGDPSALVAAGEGEMLDVTVPSDACQRFGPDPPPQAPGQPPLRPRDPDETGGYYQPLRVNDGKGVSFELQRVTCDLANASASVAAQFHMQYMANDNPTLAAVTITNGGAPVSLDAVPHDTVLTLTATWSADSAESYALFDPTTRTITTAHETLLVSWFGTTGTLELDRSGAADSGDATDATNTWRTPSEPGPAYLWIVLRDDRGGVDWMKLTATVQ